MPAGTPLLDRILKAIEPLRTRIEVFLSGRAPDDPLYLTNRSWKQKAKVASVIAAPVLLLAFLFAAAATDMFRFHKVDPFEHPLTETQAPAALPLKHVPDPVMGTSDLEVVNIHISKEARPPVVTGLVRNNTDQKVDSAEVSYYLADTAGSLVGTDTTDVANVAPHGSVAFKMPLKVANAAYVIVRDVHPE